MTDGVLTVIDADARIRRGPPDFDWLYPKRVPRFARVRILAENGKYVRVEGLRGKEYGWTARANLATFYGDSTDLAQSELAPSVPVAVLSRWPAEKKYLAQTFNRLGGLFGRVAVSTRIEPNACLAVWQVESGGRTHTPRKATIRFENHLLFRGWGDQHPETYDRHFRHGGRKETPGKAWQNHQFRETTSGSWENVHGSQSSNYRALELATSLESDDSALPCISIGGPQILVSNFHLLGYRSPRAMYEAFQDSERAHVLGFFDYCRHVLPNEGLLETLRKRQWPDFAAGYNGPGNVETYSTSIQAAYELAASFPVGPQ